MRKRVDLEFRDLSNCPEPCFYRHPLEDIDPEQIELVPIEKASSAIRWMIGYIIDARENALYAAIRLARVSGMVLPEATLTMREVARRRGVTRAAESKDDKDLRAQLHLKCSRANKRLSCSDTYRKTNVHRKKNTFHVEQNGSST